MKKLLTLLIMSIFLFSLCSAAIEQSESKVVLGTFKQGECFNLIQTCANCTSVNITSITYQNISFLASPVKMTKAGTFYNYTFCNTSLRGEYLVTGVGDLDGYIVPWNYYFNIGEAILDNNVLLIGLMILLVAFSFFLFLVGKMFEAIYGKLFFITMAGVIFAFAIALGINGVQQYLSTVSPIVTIINYLWYLLMVLIGGGLILAMFFALIYALDKYKIARGRGEYSDEDD